MVQAISAVRAFGLDCSGGPEDNRSVCAIQSLGGLAGVLESPGGQFFKGLALNVLGKPAVLIHGIDLQRLAFDFVDAVGADQFVEGQLSHHDVVVGGGVGVFDDAEEEIQFEDFHAAVHIAVAFHPRGGFGGFGDIAILADYRAGARCGHRNGGVGVTASSRNLRFVDRVCVHLVHL